MAAQPAILYSVAEYLALEDAATTKNEYYQGEIFAMAGASYAHNQITANTYLQIGKYLEDKTYSVFQSDLKIQVAANSLITYPDITIVCEPVEIVNEKSGIIANPSVLIEVLSPSTQDYDRGGKFTLYRSLPSLQEYILINSLAVHIEQFTKQPNGTWILQEYKLPTDAVTIHTIDLTLTMDLIYKGVSF